MSSPDAPPYLLALMTPIHCLPSSLCIWLRRVRSHRKIGLTMVVLIDGRITDNTGMLLLLHLLLLNDAVASDLVGVALVDELLALAIFLLDGVVVGLLGLGALTVVAGLEIDHISRREVHVRNVSVVDDMSCSLRRHTLTPHRILLCRAVHLQPCCCLAAGHGTLADASTRLRLSYHAHLWQLVLLVTQGQL